MKLSKCVPLSILAVVLWISAFAQTPSAQEDHFTRSFSVSSGGTLVVENYKGTIDINGTSGNQVAVTVNKAFEGSESDRKWWMENTRVTFDNDSSRVRVKVEYPSNNCNFGCDRDHSDYTASVELTIQVPREINLEIDGYKPNIKLASVEGDIRVKSYKSPIDIESTTGSINVSTYKESVRLHDVSLRGELRIKMEKGDATIEARTLGNDAEIETGKRTILLRVPRTAGINLDYSGNSRRSSFHSDLPITSESGFRDGEIRGSINGGGTHLRVRNDRGSFTIEGLL